MATFHFKATNQAGEMIEGDRDAVDQFTLYQDLKKEGTTVLFAVSKSKKFSPSWTKVFAGFGGVSMIEKISFARNLSAMLQAGLSLPRALSVMERQTKNKKFQMVLSSLGASVAKGQTLADSLKTYANIFPPLFISMVKAGEEGGTLSGSLKIVASQMNQLYLLEQRVRGAMIYPAILIGLMGLIAVLMLIFVVPSLTATFTDLNVDLPWSTKLIIFISDLFKEHLVLVGVAAGFLLLALVVVVRQHIGKKYIDAILLRIPVISNLIIETNTARTARTLSSLLSSGVSAVAALDIVSEVVQNIYYRKVLKKAAEAIQTGSSLYSVFQKEETIYPPFFNEMVGIGEETGKLSPMLMDVASFYEEEVERKTKDFSAVIEPILMIIVGLLVGFFAVSMIMPIYSLTSAF